MVEHRSPATGGGGAVVLDNGFFVIMRNPGDVKCRIRSVWVAMPPLGLGRQPQMSKTILPQKLGETIKDPVRSLLCLRAWMLWRARSVPAWLEARPERSRLFREEAERLFVDVKKLQPQAGGLLGHPTATQSFRDWAPDVSDALTP